MTRLAAMLALIVAAPLLVLIGIAVWLEDGGPPLFHQTRVGWRGAPFTLWKFRSMRNRDGLPITRAGDSRITRVGACLRATKLDELPQLWNIVRGEMAWIGPRPEVPEFVDWNDPLWRQVLELRPGLADAASFAFRNEPVLLAQVADPAEHYRREILPQKLRLSLEYAERRASRPAQTPDIPRP